MRYLKRLAPKSRHTASSGAFLTTSEIIQTLFISEILDLIMNIVDLFVYDVVEMTTGSSFVVCKKIGNPISSLTPKNEKRDRR